MICESERSKRSNVPPTDIEVACYGYEGIDAVKEALRAGLSCSTEAMPIKVRHGTYILVGIKLLLGDITHKLNIQTVTFNCVIVLLPPINVLDECDVLNLTGDRVLSLADQPDRSTALRDDDDHAGAHRGPVCPQPGHGRYQGEDRGEERRLQHPDGGERLLASFIFHN